MTVIKRHGGVTGGREAGCNGILWLEPDRAIEQLPNKLKTRTKNILQNTGHGLQEASGNPITPLNIRFHKLAKPPPGLYPSAPVRIRRFLPGGRPGFPVIKRHGGYRSVLRNSVFFPVYLSGCKGHVEPSADCGEDRDTLHLGQVLRDHRAVCDNVQQKTVSSALWRCRPHHSGKFFKNERSLRTQHAYK